MPSHAERVVRHRVGLVPGDLLGQEPRRSRGRARSAAGRRSSRRSRAARPPRSPRRTLQEEALAGHELAGHRLPAGHVGVGLDPHAADRQRTGRGATFSLIRVEQVRVVLLHPGVLLRRRAGEDERRVGVGQGDRRWRRCGRTCGSVSRTGQSQARVDVGVTDRDDPVRAGRGRVGPARRRARPRPSAAVPATSSGSTTSTMRDRACRISARRGSRSGSAYIRPAQGRRCPAAAPTPSSSRKPEVEPLQGVERVRRRRWPGRRTGWA